MRHAPVMSRLIVSPPTTDAVAVKRRTKRIFRLEQRFLVFLQILAVADRQPLHRRQPAAQPADHAPGLAADELQRIGILLLRHQAAAGRRRVGQLEEPNSSDVKRIMSSASRLRCTIVSDEA